MNPAKDGTICPSGAPVQSPVASAFVARDPAAAEAELRALLPEVRKTLDQLGQARDVRSETLQMKFSI